MREFSGRSGTATAVVIGPLFLDVIFSAVARVPTPGEELWSERCSFVAGGTANQARALHRIGYDARLCSYLGEDGPGQMVATLLHDDGLSTTLLQPTAHQAVTAAISVGDDRAMISAGSNEAPPLSGPAPDVLMGDLRALGRNREMVHRWREHGTLVIGDVGWDESGQWDRSDLAPLDLVDVFVPNEDEARHYTRTDSARAAAVQLTRLVPTAVVTRGARGVVAASRTNETDTPVSNDGVLSLPTFPAQTVDPTGAGDVFSAVLAWGLARGGTLRQAVSAACVAGAMSTERLGGDGAPSLRELTQRAVLSAGRGYDLTLLTSLASH